MITHPNLCSQVEAFFQRVPLGPGCRMASIIPLSHLFELTAGLLYAVAAGVAIHYVPSRRGPDVVRVLSEQRITHMLVVPQLLTLMGQALKGRLEEALPRPLSKALWAAAPRLPWRARRLLFWPVHRRIGGELRLLLCGGAALSGDTQRLWERLGVRVIQGYGVSECSPGVACGSPDGSTPIGSVGRPLHRVETRLSDESELFVRGPNVMRGYWHQPARTAEVLSDDGWYRTGDLASVDDNGNIRITGRARDLIVLPSGLKVWPEDVEEVLRAHPAIRDAVVLGAPAAAGGLRLHAYLLPKTEADRLSDVAVIVAACNGHLAAHQRVATASWWDASDFPRTTILKVRRHLLPPPESARIAVVEGVLAADDPVGQAVAAVARVPRVETRQTLAEIGLDSLGLVELATLLEEKLGQPVGDSDLRTDMTVDQVRQTLRTRPLPDDPTAPPVLSAEPPLWPYTWGRAFRMLALPFDLLYRAVITRTIVLGAENLAALPAGRAVIFAGTHHGFPDMSLVRWGIQHSPARGFASRIVVVAGAEGFPAAGWYARFAVLAFGLYPLHRYGARGGSLARLARLTAEGNALLVFPQGQHARPEQEHAADPSVAFRPGVGHLAASLDALVVPFGVAGTELTMPAHLEHFRGAVVGGIPVACTRGPLAIAFGEPLTVQEHEEPTAFVARLQVVSLALTRDAEVALAGAQAKGTVLREETA
jgi:long-chain acyl-CoA synthetase